MYIETSYKFGEADPFLLDLTKTCSSILSIVAEDSSDTSASNGFVTVDQASQTIKISDTMKNSDYPDPIEKPQIKKIYNLM